jgi:sortase A
MFSKKVPYREGNSIVIYDSRTSGRSRSGRVAKWFGSFLFSLSIVSLVLFLLPIFYAEINYRYHQFNFRDRVSLPEPEIEDKTLSGFGQLLWLEEKGILSPDNWDFSIIIPKLGINAKVVSSVNPADKEEYETALKTGVAHAEGTSFPGEQGLIYIFGHSTDYPWNIARYNALFYPLRYLGGDEEIILVYQGKNYLYQVEEKRITEANELEYLIAQEEEKKLVLQTCWPPGTTFKRLIVIATPKET